MKDKLKVQHRNRNIQNRRHWQVHSL